MKRPVVEPVPTICIMPKIQKRPRIYLCHLRAAVVLDILSGKSRYIYLILYYIGSGYLISLFVCVLVLVLVVYHSTVCYPLVYQAISLRCRLQNASAGVEHYATLDSKPSKAVSVYQLLGFP